MSNTRIIEIPATMQTGKGKNHAIRKLRVAAYCRVSTEEEEQQSSFETQKLYYTEKITSTPEWEIAGIVCLFKTLEIVRNVSYYAFGSRAVILP